MPLFPANFLLSTLDGRNGFKLNGVAIGDRSGNSVANAGDVNGDGYGDIIIGAMVADPNGLGSGASYVVFGGAGPFAASIDLATLNGTNGFRISGEAQFDTSGRSVASAGDVNGDGYDDVIVGAESAGAGGASYVVFGKASGFAANINLSTLNGSNGFRIDGAAVEDLNGTSVHAAGDFNGDGFGDIIVGSPGKNLEPAGFSDAGAAYVLFGKAGGFAPVISLASLSGSSGFIFNGQDPAGQVGATVTGYGDFNGDGLDDVIISSRANKMFLVYGTTGPIGGIGTTEIVGEGEFDRAGASVSSAGDINGDGKDDIIIGAPFNGGVNIGASYVVLGRQGGLGSTLRLRDLDGTNGFKLVGEANSDAAGTSVSAAGDINGDGYADIIIGASGNDAGPLDSGASYVIFGRQANFGAVVRLSTLNGRNGFKISGEAIFDVSGASVSAAGDVNGDGFDDLIIGAPGAGGAVSNGASYVIFGQATRAINRTGTEGDDEFTGGEFNDTFAGLEGNDLIRGGAGNDDIEGGEGNDTLNGGGGIDEVSGGEGNDTVEGGDGDDRVLGDNGNDQVSGGEGTDLIIAGAGDDTIIASTGNDDIRGGPGNDTLSFARFTAGVTIDLALGTYTHPNGTDVQTFTSIENVTGSSRDDLIVGDGLDNRLNGGGGNDVIAGDAGKDIITGGTGIDIMDGGAEADTFMFLREDFSPAGNKRDTITGFRVKEIVSAGFIDRINLASIDANGSIFGDPAFTFIGLANFTAPGQVRVFQSGNDAIVQVNTTGTTSTPEMEIVLANFTASLLQSVDFVL